MPTIEALLTAAPVGFSSACKELNNLLSSDEQQFTTLLELAIQSVKSSVQQIPTIANYKKECYEALLFILRAINFTTPSAPEPPKIATSLDSFTILNRTTIAAIITGMKIESNIFTNTQSHRLDNFQWKIGVALTSSNCKHLMTPYVSISFNVVNANGNKVPHTAELTYDEFQQFKSTFLHVGKVMDRF